jgi:uncharacterized small protein (DUF1192 family)
MTSHIHEDKEKPVLSNLEVAEKRRRIAEIQWEIAQLRDEAAKLKEELRLHREATE